MNTNQIDGGSTSVVAVPPRPAISDEVRAAAERLGVGQYLDDVIAFTMEIFGSFSDVKVELDPEAPDWEHIVFSVPVAGSVDDAVDKDMLWAQRRHATIPQAPRLYSIAMDYQE